MARKLTVEIVGDASSLNKAFKQAGADTQQFGRKFGAVAKTAGIAALGIGAGVAFGLKKAIDSANEHAVAAAQTNAVLKSTGKAANVTRDEILGLSDAIEKKSGMDDLAVQSGENLLLTFTNIQNKAGKGNDIFTQTVGIMADMSQALGQDTKSSALQLGKALNDPVKGVTALQRVGVSFTKGQKEQIKQLVASGRTMDAQKLILRELNKEFGGSAEAAGRTLPGQLKILQARFDDLAQNVGQKLVPVLARVVGWVNSHWPEISAVMANVAEKVQASFKAIQPFLKRTFEAMQQAVAFVRKHWPEISRVVGKVAEDIQIVWAKIGPTLTKVFKIAAAAIVPILTGIATTLKGVAQIIDGIIHGKWSEVWDGLKNVVRGAFKAVKAILIAEAKIIKTEVAALARAIVAILKAPINAVIGKFNGLKVPAFKVKIPHVGSISTPEINLPNIPKLDTGGDILKTGLAVVHRGERVIPTGRINDRPTTIIVQVAGRTVAEAILPDLERIGNRATASRRGRSGSVLLSTR